MSLSYLSIRPARAQIFVSGFSRKSERKHSPVPQFLQGNAQGMALLCRKILKATTNLESRSCAAFSQ